MSSAAYCWRAPRMNRLYLLGASLVPLLGAARTLSEGATIGVCAVLLSSLHQLSMAPLRRRSATWTYVLASLLVLAALASCLQLALRAWLLPLALALGHYPALLCLQCLAIDYLLPDQGRWRLRVVCHMPAAWCQPPMAGRRYRPAPGQPGPGRLATARTAVGLVQSSASGPCPITSSRKALIS